MVAHGDTTAALKSDLIPKKSLRVLADHPILCGLSSAGRSAGLILSFLNYIHVDFNIQVV